MTSVANDLWSWTLINCRTRTCSGNTKVTRGLASEVLLSIEVRRTISKEIF